MAKPLSSSVNSGSKEIREPGTVIQLNEFLLQSLEHEMGGVKIYETALKCVVNSDLRKDWEDYLEQTRDHVKILTAACTKLGMQPDQDDTGRQVVRHIGSALVQAMEMALQAGKPHAAQLVACECVVLAETKDHMDWELIAQCAEELQETEAAALREAYEEVEDQEDEHLYHTKGWCRELWIEALGMKAVLPPPEEVKHVKTAIGAAKAEQARMLRSEPKGATEIKPELKSERREKKGRARR
jgi:rubrerythrin